MFFIIAVKIAIKNIIILALMEIHKIHETRLK